MLMGLELIVNDNLLPEVELVKENGQQHLNIKLTVWKIKYAHRFCKNREYLSVSSKTLPGKIIFK